MKKNSILVDSGYGSYLKGKKPGAIANEFLYYNPNILLWVDEFYCDKNAMAAEEQDARDGFLVSELSLELRKHKIIVEKDFSKYFIPEINQMLIAESESDIDKSSQKDLLPYVIPEIKSSAADARNRFFDINSLLMLSAELDISFLNTKPTVNYFYWKFEKWSEQFMKANISVPETRSLISFNHIMDVFVPNITIFPKTKLFAIAENSKTEMIAMSHQRSLGNANQKDLERAYDKFLKAYRKYDHSVSTQAKENFDMLLSFRKDKRFTQLRNFIEEFSSKLTHTDPEIIYQEAQLKLKKELLMIEGDIISESKEIDWIDRYGAYLSFPVNFGMQIATVLTGNPAFSLLALYTNLITTANQFPKDAITRKYVWKSYLHDVKEKIDRTEQLRQIDRDIIKLNKLG